MDALPAFVFSPPDGPNDGVAPIAPTLLGMPEREAIERLRANDESIYALVYRVFRPRLVAIARDHVPLAVAEEIAQDVLALVWHQRATWPVARGIATYLYAAARNRARDHARHQGVVGRVAAEQVALEGSPGTGTAPLSPDAMIEREELGHAFIRALQQLPDGARTAFTLRWIHQLGYPEIAEVMGVSETAARKQVSRARETLLAALQSYR